QGEPDTGAAATIFQIRLLRGDRRQDWQALPHPPRPLNEHRPARQERAAGMRLVFLPRGQLGDGRRDVGPEDGAGTVRGRRPQDREQDVVAPTAPRPCKLSRRWRKPAVDAVPAGLCRRDWVVPAGDKDYVAVTFAGDASLLFLPIGLVPPTPLFRRCYILQQM